METYLFDHVAYIAGRLLTGKKIRSLYDFPGCRNIEVTHLPHAASLRAFDLDHQEYIPGYVTGCSYRYTCTGTGGSVDFSFQESTFVAHIRGTFTYLVGNVRGNFIYFYDQKDSVHHIYRITGCETEDNRTLPCSLCSLEGQGCQIIRQD